MVTLFYVNVYERHLWLDFSAGETFHPGGQDLITLSVGRVASAAPTRGCKDGGGHEAEVQVRERVTWCHAICRGKPGNYYVPVSPHR